MTNLPQTLGAGASSLSGPGAAVGRIALGGVIQIPAHRIEDIPSAVAADHRAT
jgi:hypothetical protein